MLLLSVLYMVYLYSSCSNRTDDLPWIRFRFILGKISF